MAGNKPLLSLCGIPPVVNRDGLAGVQSVMFLPFYGFWRADGAVTTFPNATAAQDKSRTIGGEIKFTKFQKEGCCNC